MKSSELNQRRQQATPRGVGVMCNYFVEKAENATLWDIEGNEVIDFAAGIAVLNTGHRHPKVVAAVADQLQAFTHTAYQIVPYESYVSLAERINDLAPIDGPAKTAFFTTGAEAVENAVKIARAYTGRPGLITFGGGFHGRTFMTMALTGKVAPYKIGFGPFPGSVYHGVYPNAAHAVLDVIAEEQLCQRAEQLGSHLQEVLNQARATCPAIVDVRGRGSMVAVEFNDPQTGEPSPEFTRLVQQKAQENGLLLLSCGVYGNVIRFLYPLTIPDAQFSKALDILARILKS